jgi:hypothetical protein
VNGYGHAARRHWERWLPGQYAAIEDPDGFFTALGEEAARQVDDLAAQLAGAGKPGEGYLEWAGAPCIGPCPGGGDRAAATGAPAAGGVRR